MGEKSPHIMCKLCNTAHPLGGPHSWDRPSATKEQRIAIADAVVKTKSSGGSSAVERRPSKPTVEGSTPSPRSKKSSPAKEHGAAGAAVLAAGVEPTDSAVSAKRGAGTKSTAARKGVHGLGEDGRRPAGGSIPPRESSGNAGSIPAISQAGTQAPPVDTQTSRGPVMEPARSARGGGGPEPSPNPKRRGRPTTGFDKKEYDRQKAAERRAKLKAAATDKDQP